MNEAVVIERVACVEWVELLFFSSTDPPTPTVSPTGGTPLIQGAELQGPRGCAVAAGSALDEAKLLAEVHVAARGEALGLDVLEQVGALLLVERVADEHALGDAVGEGARRRALVFDEDRERGTERAPKVADVGRVLEDELVRGLAVMFGRAGAGLDVRVGLDGVVPVHLDGDAAAHRGRCRRFISTPTGRLGEAVLAGGVGSGRLQVRTDRENFRYLINTGRGKWCTQMSYFPERKSRIELVLGSPATVGSLILTAANDYPERDPSSFLLGRVERDSWTMIHDASLVDQPVPSGRHVKTAVFAV